MYRYWIIYTIPSVTVKTSWWFQSIWKKHSQIGWFPQIGMNIKHVWNHQPETDAIQSRNFLILPFCCTMFNFHVELFGRVSCWKKRSFPSLVNSFARDVFYFMWCHCDAWVEEYIYAKWLQWHGKKLKVVAFFWEGRLLFYTILIIIKYPYIFM